jgi:uncharacterized membrane protein
MTSFWYADGLMDRVALEQGLRLAKQVAKQPDVARFDAAVVRNGTDGKISSHEVHDVTVGRGAIVGAIAGGVLTLLAGPLGLATGAQCKEAVRLPPRRLVDRRCRSCVSEA